jgi:phosphoglycerate dehydrogenase-like enzyme
MPAVLLHHSQSALYAEILRRTLPGVDLIVADEAESFARALPEAAIVLSDRFPTGGLGEARRLAWIQCTNAGVDFLLPAREHLSRVVVTNARGIHADVVGDVMAELIDTGQSSVPIAPFGIERFRDPASSDKLRGVT